MLGMGQVPHLLTHGTSGAWLRAGAPASPAPHPAMLPDLGPQWLDLSLPWPDLAPASRGRIWRQPAVHGWERSGGG